MTVVLELLDAVSGLCGLLAWLVRGVVGGAYLVSGRMRRAAHARWRGMRRRAVAAELTAYGVPLAFVLTLVGMLVFG